VCPTPSRSRRRASRRYAEKNSRLDEFRIDGSRPAVWTWRGWSRARQTRDPGAWMVVGGKRVKVWRGPARAGGGPTPSRCARPGELVTPPTGFSGSTRWQPEGKPRMNGTGVDGRGCTSGVVPGGRRSKAREQPAARRTRRCLRVERTAAYSNVVLPAMLRDSALDPPRTVPSRPRPRGTARSGQQRAPRLPSSGCRPIDRFRSSTHPDPGSRCDSVRTSSRATSPPHARCGRDRRHRSAQGARLRERGAARPWPASLRNWPVAGRRERDRAPQFGCRIPTGSSKAASSAQLTALADAPARASKWPTNLLRSRVARQPGSAPSVQNGGRRAARRRRRGDLWGPLRGRVRCSHGGSATRRGSPPRRRRAGPPPQDEGQPRRSVASILDPQPRRERSVDAGRRTRRQVHRNRRAGGRSWTRRRLRRPTPGAQSRPRRFRPRRPGFRLDRGCSPGGRRRSGAAGSPCVQRPGPGSTRGRAAAWAFLRRRAELRWRRPARWTSPGSWSFSADLPARPPRVSSGRAVSSCTPCCTLNRRRDHRGRRLGRGRGSPHPRRRVRRPGAPWRAPAGGARSCLPAPRRGHGRDVRAGAAPCVG